MMKNNKAEVIELLYIKRRELLAACISRHTEKEREMLNGGRGERRGEKRT